MRRLAAHPVLATLGALVVLGMVAFVAIVWGGAYKVSAREGHWPPTVPVLHTTYRSSVRVHAPPASEVPELTSDLARLGARHYDAACRTCHAAPGEPQTATMRSMEPQPPPIAAAIEGWEPRHLGWILQEGVIMSGMPAWPSIRDDEAWAVVAFLVRVPGMTAEAYDELVAPAPATEPFGLDYCAGCHGLDGRSGGNPHIPRLDVLDEAYLAASLTAYVEDARESGIMAHAASEVAPEDLAALAAHFAAQVAPATTAPVDAARAEAGRALAFAATGDPDVPACAACHGPAGAQGPSAPPTGPGPALAGQHEAYLATQLRLWRADQRGGGLRAGLMRQAARDLGDAEIDALAAYYAGLPPAE